MRGENSGGVKSEETQATEIKRIKSNHVQLRNTNTKKQNRNQFDWRQSRMTETQVPAEWLLSLHPVPCWMDEAGPAQQPHQECAVVQGTRARAGREATVVLRLRGSGRPAEGKKQHWSQFSSCCYITDQIGARRWNYNHTLLVVLTQWSKRILFILWKLHWTRAYRKRPSIKKGWIKGRPTMVFSVFLTSTLRRRFCRNTGSWTLKSVGL